MSMYLDALNAWWFAQTEAVRLGIFAWVVLAFVGSYVAIVKRRPGVEGFALTLLLGPLGLVVEALLPTVEAEADDEDEADENE